MKTPITKIVVRRSSCGSKHGWAFEIYWANRPYPNFASALYKTKREAIKQLNRYLSGNGFDYWGSAEV